MNSHHSLFSSNFNIHISSLYFATFWSRGTFFRQSQFLNTCKKTNNAQIYQQVATFIQGMIASWHKCTTSLVYAHWILEHIYHKTTPTPAVMARWAQFCIHVLVWWTVGFSQSSWQSRGRRERDREVWVSGLHYSTDLHYFLPCFMVFLCVQIHYFTYLHM